MKTYPTECSRSIQALQLSDLGGILDFLQNEVSPKELCRQLDELTFQFSFYALENEEAFPDSRKQLHLLRMLRDQFGNIANCPKIVH